MKGKIHAFHMRHGSMICTKCLQKYGSSLTLKCSPLVLSLRRTFLSNIIAGWLLEVRVRISTAACTSSRGCGRGRCTGRGSPASTSTEHPSLGRSSPSAPKEQVRLETEDVLISQKSFAKESVILMSRHCPRTNLILFR